MKLVIMWFIAILKRPVKNKILIGAAQLGYMTSFIATCITYF